MSSVANQMRFLVQNPIQDRTLSIRKPLACQPASLVYTAMKSKEETLPQIRPEMQLDPCSLSSDRHVLAVACIHSLPLTHMNAHTHFFFFLKKENAIR